MRLSRAERRALDEIARHFRRSDPQLAQDLAEHGSGAPAEREVPILPAFMTGRPAMAVAGIVLITAFLMPLMAIN
ncbi:DUF3040 domain-containing protein [Herbidospora sp. NBRC 101105]|uniref:DUF3040 domain-containing protein n=1 Tax=Herbidospora sp. NBRC 101105 TaxID=3032195 RepID=UPI0024A138F8|nr:DUF3040 domain-containing protein [Herbidospora sp. NBRC 101105]GLX92670.1 hypothetical protein Hesp01_06200 [Herbidospora sp. NBRC 101105]